MSPGNFREVWTNLLALFIGNSATDDLYLIFVKPLKVSAIGVASSDRQVSIAREHSQDPKWQYFPIYSFPRKTYNIATALKCHRCSSHSKTIAMWPADIRKHIPFSVFGSEVVLDLREQLHPSSLYRGRTTGAPTGHFELILVRQLRSVMHILFFFFFFKFIFGCVGSSFLCEVFL